MNNVITVQPDHHHLYTVIIMHGMDQSVDDIHHIVNKIKIRKKNTKFLIPVAGTMDMGHPGYPKRCKSWYNYYTKRDNLRRHDTINNEEFNDVTEGLIGIIKQESKIVTPGMLSIVGISQGGTVCINAALRLKFKIKNIKCIDTIFLHTHTDTFNCVSQYFQVLISNKDEIYRPEFQEYCYDILESYGNVISLSYRDNFHCEDVDSMADFIIKNY